MVGMGDVRLAEAEARYRFALHLRTNALPPYGKGKCARYVRLALEAAHVDTSGHPVHAKDYGRLLLSRRFRQVALAPRPDLGDITVFDAVAGHPSGHIQGWDGASWISDFRQPRFFPHRDYEGGAYQVYRWP